MCASLFVHLFVAVVYSFSGYFKRLFLVFYISHTSLKSWTVMFMSDHYHVDCCDLHRSIFHTQCFQSRLTSHFLLVVFVIAIKSRKVFMKSARRKQRVFSYSYQCTYFSVVWKFCLHRVFSLDYKKKPKSVMISINIRSEWTEKLTMYSVHQSK